MPSPELLTALVTPWSIPSPSQGVWYLGPFPIRGYALCIIAGIVAGIVVGERRWIARGGRAGDVQDIALLAVPFGLIGGRLYHVATDWETYFGAGRDPISALYVWRGGLGIWGAVALGAVGAYLACRAKGIRFGAMGDALAPGVLLGQAIGRWGNWFNQELYGRPTELPWGLEIDPAHWPTQCDYPPGSGTCTFDIGTTFHPTFLYESLWNLGGFLLLLWLSRRFQLGYGRTVAAYVMVYTAGRGWIEYLRIDDVQLESVHGLRWNVWVSMALFLLAAAYLVWSGRRHPGQQASVYRPGCDPEPESEPGSEPKGTPADIDSGSSDRADSESADDAELSTDD